MTATFNMTLFQLLQRMLGLTITPNNIFWGSVASFSKRHIKISIRYSKQQFKIVTTHISDKLNTSSRNKHIIISSTAKKVIEFQHKLDSWLDRNATVKGDTVTVIGTHTPELKEGFTTLFTNTVFNSLFKSLIAVIKLLFSSIRVEAFCFMLAWRNSNSCSLCLRVSFSF